MSDTPRPLLDTPRPPFSDEIDMALRDGLRRLPGPPISADFDARVLAALAAPPSFGEMLRAGIVSTLRPLLCGAACSLAVTLLALFWTLHAPAAVPSPAGAPRAVRPLDMAGVDTLLSQPKLGASSLAAWAYQSAVPIAALSPPPAPRDSERRPHASRRRASRLPQTLLTA